MSQVGMLVIEASLRCLKRPIVWAAIALLLLNDHYLKGAYPSWWTGKLSDVAGLYFFPIIVAALLGGLVALLGWERFSARGIGRFAFLLVGVWFGLMKVYPAINGLTISFWEWLVNAPVFIVMDGSDLLALPVLFPAWRLWERQLGADRPKRMRPVAWDWRVWVVMGTAVFAATASSCEEPMQITQVFAVDGAIYAYAPYSFRGNDDGAFYRYDDSENIWAYEAGLGDTLVDYVSQKVEFPLTQCLPEDDAICYQITGEEKVLESEDGGQSWKTAWSVPFGRLHFMNRLSSFSLCQYPVEMGPYDLLVVGTGNSHRVVAAMGNQGALVKQPNGSWERLAVDYAIPTPYRDWSPTSILDKTFLEFIALLFVVFFYFSGQYVMFLRHFQVPRVIKWLLFLLVAASCLFFTLPDLAPTQAEFYLFILLFGGLLVFVTAYTVANKLIGGRWEIKDDGLKAKAVAIWFKSSFSLLVAGSLVLYFWSAGIIPIYWLMMVILVLVVIGIPFRAVRQYKILLAESHYLQGIPVNSERQDSEQRMD